MATKTLQFLTKCTVGGGALYLTLSQGIWSSQEKSLIAAKRMRTQITEHVPYEVVPLPELPADDMKYQWNRGVETVFNSIHEMPSTITDYSGSAMTTARNFIKDQTH